MEPRVFEYRDWVRSAPPRKVAELRRTVRLSLVMSGVLAIMAIACLAVLASVRPVQVQLIAGLLVCGLGALLLARKAMANRANLADVTGEEVAISGPYALSIGETGIHFPGSFDDREESWPLEGTTAEVRTVTRQQVVVLSHPGRTTRHFYGGALVDPVSDVVDEIAARRQQDRP